MTRTPAEIGSGLAQVRATRPIRPGERIHVVGIAGAGASAAALHARAAGAIVTGCDPGGPSPYTVALEAFGIPVEWAHDPAHIAAARPERLSVTKALTAIAPDHAELRAAARAGIPLEPWQQLVADAAHGRTLLAAAGTHGKSTTAGWLTWLLAEAGLDPSAFVGALLPAALTGGIPSTARIGRGASFVVEADEYAGNFDPYIPDVVALTTVEWDHPDVFADLPAVLDAFVAWLDRAPDATVVANLDDPGVVATLARLQDRGDRAGVVVGVSLAGIDQLRDHGAAPGELWVDRRLTGTVVERSAHGTVLDIDGLEGAEAGGESGASRSRRVHLPIVGLHAATDGLVALGAASSLAPPGSTDRLVSALASFPGIGRRLERKGEAGGVVVYDDYGHHPTAIRATIAALRQREPERRIWAVYEPLTFNRTAAMLPAFADALAEADAVAIANIWAGRDLDTTVTSSTALAAAVHRRRPEIAARAPGSVEETAAWLAQNVSAGDAVLVMGGGKSYRIAELLLEHLAGDR